MVQKIKSSGGAELIGPPVRDRVRKSSSIYNAAVKKE